jgi:hypothetical protein
MLAPLLDARGRSQQLRLVYAVDRRAAGHARFPFGERSGLVEEQRIDLRQPLERLGAPHQHADRRALADPDHDCHGRRQSERAWTGNHQHRNRRYQSVGKCRRRTPEHPRDESDDGDGDHGRHKPGRDAVDEPFNGCAAALGLGDQAHDAREHGALTDLLRPHHERASAIQRSPDHPGAGRLRNRHRLTGDHRCIDGALALEHHAVDRQCLAWPDAQAVITADQIERDFLLTACRRQTPGGFRGELEQGANCAARPRPCAQLQHLAEQDQHGDDRGGLVVNRDAAICTAHRRRKEPRGAGGRQTVEVRSADAESDEGEHIECAVADRGPRPGEERPAGSQHYRSRQHELEPVAERARKRSLRREHGNMVPKDERGAEQHSTPEPSAHVAQLHPLLVPEDRAERLERHAAHRTIARQVAPHLRVHRAGV